MNQLSSLRNMKIIEKFIFMSVPHLRASPRHGGARRFQHFLVA